MSLSDKNNHKAEAIFAALGPKIKELIERAIEELGVVSDSLVSQYRNGRLAYLTSTWVQRYGMKINWIFTEAVHGKSVADDVGGLVNILVAQKVLMEFPSWHTFPLLPPPWGYKKGQAHLEHIFSNCVKLFPNESFLFF